MKQTGKNKPAFSADAIVSAVDALEVAFALFNEDDRLVYCNPQFKHTHSGIADLLTPGLMWPIFLKEAKNTGSGNGLSRLNAHLDSGREDVLRLDANRPGDRWVRCRMQPLKNGSFVIVEADITDSHAAAELQLEAESLARRVLDASGALILMSNLETGKIAYRSQAHADFFGEIEIVNDVIVNLTEKSALLTDLLALGRIDGLEMQLRKSNGTIIPARITGRLIDFEGEEVVVTSCLDMSSFYAQREELERQREASFQNEKLSAMGELLAGVAHELNNPLSVVVGQTLMLKEELEDNALSARVDKIGTAADRCAKIIKTFLAMARQKPTKLESADLNQIIETALDVAAYGLRSNGVEILFSPVDDLPSVLADEDQIAQVFINLLVNAEQALEGRSGPNRVTLMCRYDPQTDMVVTEVSDNGPGIPAHLTAKIFQPFFTTKKVGSGTGVGLALCHRIVGTHNGKLLAQDAPGGGALFSVSLPVSSTDKVQDFAQKISTTPKGLQALIVDDEPDVADVLRDLLQSVGISGTIVGQAEDAILALKSGQTFDLIFCDLKMPGIGGMGLLDELYAKWPDLVSRFAFVTGDGMGQQAEELRRKGDIPILEKPVAPHELRSTILRLTGSKLNER